MQTSSTFIGNVNPIRYRGYYYDSETGFYYLQSRYYDPETGRFINADDPEMVKEAANLLQAKGLFTYCYNNPVNMVDKNGLAPGYINDQWDKSVKDIKWGLLGKTGPNGCGWIAVYNVMRSYSNKITYKYVINGLTLAGGVLALGKLGVNPIGVTIYLSQKFWIVYNASYSSTFWKMRSKFSNAIIILYQRKGWNAPLHYVAGIKIKKNGNGLFRFYNDSYYTQKYKGKAISVGDYINLLKSNGCKLIMFWGVSGKKGWW